MKSAGCTAAPDPDIWFAPEGSEAAQAALAICATCPVIGRCHELGKHEEAGIWGGVHRHEGGRVAGDAWIGDMGAVLAAFRAGSRLEGIAMRHGTTREAVKGFASRHRNLIEISRSSR